MKKQCFWYVNDEFENMFFTYPYVCTERFRTITHREDQRLLSPTMCPCCFHGAPAPSPENYIVFGLARSGFPSTVLSALGAIVSLAEVSTCSSSSALFAVAEQVFPCLYLFHPFWNTQQQKGHVHNIASRPACALMPNMQLQCV